MYDNDYSEALRELGVTLHEQAETISGTGESPGDLGLSVRTILDQVVYPVPSTPETSDSGVVYQRCGGGRRVFRKLIY